MKWTLPINYDHNTPPDSDGYYRLLVPKHRRGNFEIGDEIRFGWEEDQLMARGMIKDVYEILVVEKTDWENTYELDTI